MAETALRQDVASSPLGWDPYDQRHFSDPYPMLNRIREERPLYYNAQYDFYAVTRYDDCIRVLGDRDNFISGKGGVIEFMKTGGSIPSGLFIYEDPPLHTEHRGLLSRVFTPKRMAALDASIREFCAQALDPVVEAGRFDVIERLGSEMPMRVIGKLLGIPEADLKAAQHRVEENMRTEPGKPLPASGAGFSGDPYAEYVDWRIKNPSDDLITDLMNVEYTTSSGVTRKLNRDEILVLINLLFGAGNETTNRLIGWTVKVLAEHPDQRREINQNRELIPQAIEEVLRFEPTGPYIGRTVAKDTEFHGVTVPAGAIMAAVVSGANRDPRKFTDPDTFDIHRERLPHLTFGFGFHNCLGNALARVEGRIALEEMLNRFPNWNVDMSQAKMASTATVRGWEKLPTYV
jgi:cytochrome P450